MKFCRSLMALFWMLLAVSCVPAGPLPEVAPEQREDPGTGAVAETTRPGQRRPVAAPVVLGVIASQSGDPFLERFGEQVVDGIRLAVETHNRVSDQPVELVVLDDGGEPERAAELVAALEARNAVAIVGPLRPEGVAAVAAARRNPSLLLLSPTSPELPAGSNLFSLNTVDTRGAEVMADYALRSGWRRVGLLYPESPEYRSQAAVFRERLVRGGGEIVADLSYAPGTTTFADQLQSLAAAQLDAVYIPASERDVRQIAPQITYYGLAETGARILGGEGWSGDAVLNGVAARYLEGVVATAALYRSSPEFGWLDFVTLYEESYRRSLENALPALGYDAARLILRAVAEGYRTPTEVARRFVESDELRGATGWLSVRGGALGRRPILVRIEGGALTPISDGTGN